MALVLRRGKKETWRAAAIRLASNYGLQEEVGITFDKLRRLSYSVEDAAWGAAYEWDVLDYEPDKENK